MAERLNDRATEGGRGEGGRSTDISTLPPYRLSARPSLLTTELMRDSCYG